MEWSIRNAWCRAVLFLLLSVVLVPPAVAQAGREIIDFNPGWRFAKGDPTKLDQLAYKQIKPWLLPLRTPFLKTAPIAEKPAGLPPEAGIAYAAMDFDDSQWRGLTLPHDWAIEGPFDQALPGETGKLPYAGVGWYRKQFELPASDQGRRIVLNVDGAMSYANVWCNGKFIGGWPNGYLSWQVDLTPYVRPGEKNVVAIRVDNPDRSSRWYPGAGIYRNVWLVKTAALHVGQWGVVVTTPKVDNAVATVAVAVDVVNRSEREQTVEVRSHVLSGAVAATAALALPSATVTLAPGATQTVKATQSLPNPRLWSTRTPNLYTLRTTIWQDGREIDRYDTPFGVRTIEFTADRGFLLNGQRVPIQGVCQHHDLGALGGAFNTRAAERQIEILKDMGVNAIRTSHNPPAPEFLDLCDRMGVLVLNEFSDTWAKAKRRNGYAILYPDWHEADLRAFVRRDRNHPSVIAWSTGNEVTEQGEGEKGIAIAQELRSIVTDEDPTRPVTFGAHWAISGFNGFEKTVDVFGYNYKPGDYARFLKTNPRIPLWGTETASTYSSRGEYFFPIPAKQDGGSVPFHVSSYDLSAPKWGQLPDAEFKAQDQNPAVIGEFVWTGFDYLGEPTPYNTDATVLLNYATPQEQAKAAEELKTLGKVRVPARSSYFGIVDLCGFKKDRFYLYQARWRPDLPMAHLLPHWNWPDRAGQVTPVHLYTSGDEAELFLNGRSLGKKKKGAFEYRLRWDEVQYEPGELKAVVYKSGQPWATDRRTTTGPAHALHLQADRLKVKADGKELVFITASILDAGQLLVPTAKVPLQFSIEGPGTLVATDNGDPTDHTPFASSQRSSFNGLALAIVRPTSPGVVRLTVTADGLATAELKIVAEE